MVPTDNGKEIEETNGRELKSPMPLDVSTSRKTFLGNERSPRFPVAQSDNRLSLLKFGSASARFKELAEASDKASQSVETGRSFRERIDGVFSRKLDWVSLMNMCKQWIRDPMNMALFLWIATVAVSGAILFLVMTGMLNKAIPKKSQRDTWFEVNYQILNALFTLMCLYQHPKRSYHLVLLCRWKPQDISSLRKVYCNKGTYKPQEWKHMMVVVLLLHLNCFAQYALCGLNLGYKRSERPAIGLGICISFAFGAPAVAGIYNIISPIGKDYELGLDKEPQWLKIKPLERRYSLAFSTEQLVVENRPQWSGGVLDIWDDISLAYVSLFCSFCLFGWNMERLGFGNMYVHIMTFILFCIAPLWIFNVAAVNIDNETIREVFGVIGLVLCLFGLLYGGFWRIQMRKRFNLPSFDFCFGEPALADCTLWLFCCWCSLAQEVRTGNSYDIVEEIFHRKLTENDSQVPISPLPLEDGGVPFRSGPNSPQRAYLSPTMIGFGGSPSPSRFSKGIPSPDRPLSTVKEESHVRRKDGTMIPPAPSLIEKEGT